VHYWETLTFALNVRDIDSPCSKLCGASPYLSDRGGGILDTRKQTPSELKLRYRQRTCYVFPQPQGHLLILFVIFSCINRCAAWNLCYIISLNVIIIPFFTCLVCIYAPLDIIIIRGNSFAVCMAPVCLSVCLSVCVIR